MPDGSTTQCASAPESEWVSDCCGARMSTAGGDGSGMGETCWAVCRACRQPCDPAIKYPKAEEA